jgi:hypothetical protein
MQHTFIAAVETFPGRDVLAFISNHHVGPDLEIALFMLRPQTAAPNRDLHRRRRRLATLAERASTAGSPRRHRDLTSENQRLLEVSMPHHGCFFRPSRCGRRAGGSGEPVSANGAS